MCAKNKKLKEGGWPGFRGALMWLLRKATTGVLSLGLQGGIVVALIVAGLVGLALARRQVSRMPQYSIYPGQFRAQAPPWCAGDLAQVKFPRECYSIFDASLTADVAAAYAASPWVKAVRRVEKRFPNHLSVELDLREPAAFVRLPDASHAVDNDGVCLPLAYEKWDHEQRPLPLIFGVKSQPPEPGKRWSDPGTLAALSVLQALATEPTLFHQVHFVDVSNLEGVIDPQRSEVLLFTRRRVRVAWGRPPNTTRFGEPSVPCKLARLRRYLSQPAALADGSSAGVDLRFPEDDAAPVSRTPVRSTDHASTP
ncbi:MAG: hypothetical protein FJ290_13690 [Planctomycetes bacterium]|nr:hypothetical protein [Planctomycetota bacterium]